MTKSVVVAMSGGVDSSVAAAILKDQGYNVIGMMLNMWSESSTKFNKCCNLGAVMDARNVASKLNIPFYYLDIKEQFKQIIVDPFIKSYSDATTPNPCLSCNSQIRFGILLNKALELGADFLATGHYAITKNENDEVKLLQAKDETKDQSYMLHRLTQDQLNKAKFPLGSLLKSEVRELAFKYELPVFNKHDSQDLCFLGDLTQAEFIKKFSKQEVGDIVTQDGSLIGKHQGLGCYTVGQRKGLNIKSNRVYYVTKLDKINNRLIVAENEQRGECSLTCRTINFISNNPPKLPYNCQVRIRYKSAAVDSVLSEFKDGRLYIGLKKSIKDITPGQGAVFYNGAEVIGGGIIV